MNDDERDRRIAELERLAAQALTLYIENAVRLEAVRVLCETKGVFAQAEFEDAVKTLDQRGADEAERDLANAQAGRSAWLAELLRKYEPGPTRKH